ncbi:SGA1 [Candida metapsilosis]|uniref:glucan 1,4-alpha-glucosidase n=1 Tax=Candida metapsilosis TaxID=273372 RepID=A0A8H8DCB2_9ASCO|nr:SGA1 [Candida metapsilosis]
MKLAWAVIIFTILGLLNAQPWPYQILPPTPIIEGYYRLFAFFGVDQCTTSLSSITPLSLSTTSIATASATDVSPPEFETWLEIQQNTSLHAILQNINSDGVIVASPSRQNPNYYYQWIRDSAITVRTLISYLEDLYESNANVSQLSNQVANLIELYVLNSYCLQRTPNRSGNFSNWAGLAEPKFNVDMTAFDDSWGRPQRDGPGLRAMTIIQFVDYLNRTNNEVSHPELKDLKYIYKEIIKPDLQYICQYWNETGFDLWEEVDSIHFFTSLVQLKALQMGIRWSRYFNDEEGGFTSRLVDSFDILKRHVNDDFGFTSLETNHVVESPQLLESGERFGLDIASILAVIYTHENDDKEEQTEEAQSRPIPFTLFNPYVLNSISGLIFDMRQRYPINENRFGVALGRYPEDVYNGVGTSEGNPWFIATATASEFIYQFIYNLQSRKSSLKINDANRQFFQPLINITESEYILEYNTTDFNSVVSKLTAYADSFLDVVRTHTDSQGRMSEQFNKYTGYMQGAKDLTWSYSAVWNAIRWRKRALAI